MSALTSGDRLVRGVPSQEVKYAAVDVAAGATAAIVAGVTGKKIRVLGYVLNNAGSAGTIVLKSATTGITGTMGLATNGTVASGFSPVGWFETVAGEALNVTTVTCTVDGHVLYTEI